MNRTRVLSAMWLALVMTLLLAACGTASTGSDMAEVDVADLPDSLTVDQVVALQDDPNVLVLDVREIEEYEAGHIPGVTHLPMGEVASRLNEIPQDQTVIVTCRTGNRSGQVAGFLREQGYTNVHNMAGGIVEWQNAGLPVEQ